MGNFDVSISYHHPASGYCLKIKALADTVTPPLKIVYSFGDSRVQYQQIKATIKGVEFIDQYKPLANIKNTLRELARNVAMLFY